MRAHLAILLLLLATPLAASDPSVSDGRGAAAWRTTMADDPTQWTLQVSRDSHVTLTVTVKWGHWDGLRLDGPGACNEADLGGDTMLPGSNAIVRNQRTITFELDCGVVPHGRYTVEIGVDTGAARGTIDIAGGRLQA